MADLDLGQHGAQAAGGAAAIATIVTTALARVFRARDERADRETQAKSSEEIRTRLALIEQRLGDFTNMMKLYGDIVSRVGIVERDVQAAHKRLDDQIGKRGA